MALPRQNRPPASRTSYVIPQLEGECITIPGSKGVFRILASAKETGGSMSVFQSGSVLSDAPGFHHHENAHDIFMVTKGYLKLYNGDQCRIMAPGDFASIPPKVIHNPDNIGPHTEIIGLITPGDWVDFFRYVGEPFKGLIVPETDNRNLKSLLIPKVMAAKDRFDVIFHRDYQPPEVGEWTDADTKIPDSTQPYFLRANTGPRWMAGGVMSRPFITTAQSDGKFAISSIESSQGYGTSVFSRYMAFPSVDHCFCMLEGALAIRLKDSAEETVVREGETAVVAAGQPFSLEFQSKYARFWSFASGDGIETVVHLLGSQVECVLLPDTAPALDESRVTAVLAELGVKLE